MPKRKRSSFRSKIRKSFKASHAAKGATKSKRGGIRK